MTNESFPLIGKTFTGLESVLADELTELGAGNVLVGRRMVSFTGDQALLYRANIWCRTAVRILKPIATFELDPAATDASPSLYAGLQQIDWARYLAVDGTLAIDPVVHGAAITNSLYASQVAKDAIADWFRERHDRRPNVDRREPDLRINLHIDGERVTVYLDASGQSLHKRGYRRETNEAPLNEVLAAGILRLTGWDRRSPLVDFLCGSGTLPIEAALWARNIAPGLIRRQFGYMRWLDYDKSLHHRLMDEARQARRADAPPIIYGSDLDPQVLAAARDNAARAGVEGDVRLDVANFDVVAPPASAGTIVINPPYDERMHVERIAPFYRRMGDVLKRRWTGYTAWLFSGNPEAAKQIGLKTAARVRLFNGPIECRLLKFPLFAGDMPGAGGAAAIEPAAADMPPDETEMPPVESTARRPSSSEAGIEAFRNRLRRMGKHWSRWARRQQITCYRIYDRDIPEVSLSIDRYEDQLHIVEHARPHDRTPIEQQVWLDDLIRVAAEELGVQIDRIHAHRRDRTTQLDRFGVDKLSEAHEAGHTYLVNLASRGAVGLPLDERELRKMIAAESMGKRFLNVFGAAGSASLAAAGGGAVASVTIEGSAGLAAWSRSNLARNACSDAEHVVIATQAIEFLEHLERQQAAPFDLALVAPPAGFHRRDASEAWDARPEYLRLLSVLVPRIAPGGKIYLLTRVRRFRLEPGDLAQASIREITRQTTPPDFRDKPPHRCWSILRA